MYHPTAYTGLVPMMTEGLQELQERGQAPLCLYHLCKHPQGPKQFALSPESVQKGSENYVTKGRRGVLPRGGIQHPKGPGKTPTLLGKHLDTNKRTLPRSA